MRCMVIIDNNAIIIALDRPISGAVVVEMALVVLIEPVCRLVTSSMFIGKTGVPPERTEAQL